jgi:hypothetical protein
MDSNYGTKLMHHITENTHLLTTAKEIRLSNKAEPA